MIATDFDMERFLRVSARLDTTDVDWSMVAKHPLSDADVRILKYMMDTEYNTVMYMRELLQTSCSTDPQVTAFMCCWNFEELWHGEVLSRVLTEYGIDRVDGSRTQELRERRRMRQLFDQLKFMAYSTLVKDFVAIAMAWGALNELTACHAYKALVRKSGHPVLAQILPRIIKQERRHFAFYFGQARLRMDRRPWVPRLVRTVIDNVWQPVGSGLVPQEDVDFVMMYLFGDEEGQQALRDADQQYCSLPGMEGANPLMTVHRKIAARWQGGLPVATPIPPRPMLAIA